MADVCAWFVAHLGDYSEGILSDEDRRAMAAHRLGCRRCAEALRDYDAIPAAIRRATAYVMPPGARARLHRSLARLWRPRR
jgi:hypothetical protein